MPSLYTIIGLMSGTSLDGVDCALIETDGQNVINRIDFISREYPEEIREQLRECLGEKDVHKPHVIDAEHSMTLFQAELVLEIINKNKSRPIDAIGFHGQSIYHAPEDGMTIQIGDAALMAEHTGLDVVYDFRTDDVKNGGEGAPLLPLYHRAIALTQKTPLPVTFLNIGGVSNITQINGPDDDQIFACDTGPGNALIDDFVLQNKSIKYDTNGIIASSGSANQDIIDQWLEHPYFQKDAPKSLDRSPWDVSAAYSLSFEDAVSTISSFTVQSIAKHINKTNAVYVCGGGRHNDFIMKGLSDALSCPVLPIEKLGYNGDSIEAEGFAYLAARVLSNKPTSLPSTTGVSIPICGGKTAKPERLNARA